MPAAPIRILRKRTGFPSLQTMQTTTADILVVEDDPSIGAVLEEILTGKNYTVRVATNPAEAIAAVGARVPELVLVDVSLGSDIDGIETVKRLRVDYEDLPVCFITAQSDDETVNRAAEVGPMGYLVKPFEMADVLRTVNISLARARRLKDRPKKMAQQQPGAAPPATAPPSRPAEAAEALEDKSTGLPNRLWVERRVAEWQDPQFLAVLSVDHVHLLRQRFGSSAVEQILFSYTQHLGQHLPDYCSLARWDSSTFVVLPERCDSEAQREVARVVASPMLHHLRLPGRSALLRISATMRVVKAVNGPVVEQIETTPTLVHR